MEDRKVRLAFVAGFGFVGRSQKQLSKVFFVWVSLLKTRARASQLLGRLGAVHQHKVPLLAR